MVSLLLHEVLLRRDITTASFDQLLLVRNQEDMRLKPTDPVDVPMHVLFFWNEVRICSIAPGVVVEPSKCAMHERWIPHYGCHDDESTL